MKHAPAANAATLNAITSTRSHPPDRSEVTEDMAHEQRFRPELEYFQPDVQLKVVASLEWLEAHGCRSVFYDNGLLGSPPPPHQHVGVANTDSIPPSCPPMHAEPLLGWGSDLNRIASELAPSKSKR